MGFLGNLIGRLFGRKGRDENDFLSIVFLLSEPRSVEDKGLQQRVAKTLQRRFKLDAPPVAHTNQMSPEAVGVAFEGMPFALMSVSKPYLDTDPKEVTPDMRLQRILAEHKAWLACDWMMPIKSDDEKAIAYRMLGEVMAATGGANVIGVLDKDTGRLAPFGPGTLDQLCGPDPRSAFEATNPPILAGDPSEEQLAAAAKEAQDRLPEFVKAFAKRKRDQIFSVKTDFTEGEEVEWMWVNVEHVEGDTFEGRLGNEPALVGNYKLNDRVSVKADKVVDWMYSKADGEDGWEGGFSVKVLADAQK